MRITYLLRVAISFIPSFQAQAISFEKTEIKLQKHVIDSMQLGEILEKQASDWQTLTPKEIAVKGTIINLDMDNDGLLEQHTQTSIQCMDTN